MSHSHPAIARWDDYRASYPKLSDAEQRAFYEEVERDFPVQRHGHGPACRRFLDELRGMGDLPPAKVVEFGGWDGYLGSVMLAEGRASSWFNIEISPAALRCPPEVEWVRPSSFRWWRGPLAKVFPGSVAVATHVLEHFSDEDAFEMLTMLKPEAWFLEAPLEENGQVWDGNISSHVMNRGWRGVVNHLAKMGYKHAWTMDHARAFVR